VIASLKSKKKSAGKSSTVPQSLIERRGLESDSLEMKILTQFLPFKIVNMANPSVSNVDLSIPVVNILSSSHFGAHHVDPLHRPWQVQ